MVEPAKAKESDYNDMTSDTTVTKVGKKRGRKLTAPAKYFADSEKKINKWRDQLERGAKDDGTELSKKEKEGLRNRISAQISRRNKKTELASLQQQVAIYRSKFGVLLKTLTDEVPDKPREKVQSKIYAELEEKPSLADVPKADRFATVLNSFMFD